MLCFYFADFFSSANFQCKNTKFFLIPNKKSEIFHIFYICVIKIFINLSRTYNIGSIHKNLTQALGCFLLALCTFCAKCFVFFFRVTHCKKQCVSNNQALCLCVAHRNCVCEHKTAVLAVDGRSVLRPYYYLLI